MPEWLQSTGGTSPEPTLVMTAARVGLAILFGAMVSGLHRWCRGPGDSRHSLSTTLILLSVLIALVTLVIGNSIARAFGLVGALSIVRFRTVVDDTRDTAFVIFAVAVGMALGAGYPILPLVGVPAVAIVVAVMRVLEPRVRQRGTAAHLILKVGVGMSPDAVVDAAGERIRSRRLKEISTVKQGVALEAVYELHLAPNVDRIALLNDLNAVPGVQGVELKSG
jgi:uncharacterized membrane protein YhiD involved in acid resistance